MQAQEEKVQILVAIHSSLPAVTEKATLLCAAGVLNPDTATITGADTSSSQETGTSTRGNPSGSQDLLGGSGTTTSLDHSRLPATPGSANQLPYRQWHGLSIWSWGREGLQEQLWRELNEVHPPPSDIQGMTCNASIGVSYRDLVPMSRLFATQVPMSERN